MQASKLVIIALTFLSLPMVAWAQQQPSSNDADVKSDATELPPRERILQSPRWRRLEQSIDDWLSLQSIYTDEQIAELKSGLKARVQAMSLHSSQTLSMTPKNA